MPPLMMIGGRTDDRHHERTRPPVAAAPAAADTSTGEIRERQDSREAEANGSNVEPLRRTECVRRLFAGWIVAGRSPDVARSVAGHEERNSSHGVDGHCSTDRSKQAGCGGCRGGTRQAGACVANPPRRHESRSVGLPCATARKTDRQRVKRTSPCRVKFPGNNR